MNDVLKVRLQRPSAADFVLVDSGHQRFRASNRPGRSGQLLKVEIERASPGRNLCFCGGDAELVLRALLAQADELDASICIEVDDVAIGRTVGRTEKNPNAAIVIMRDAVKLLLKNRI